MRTYVTMILAITAILFFVGGCNGTEQQGNEKPKEAPEVSSMPSGHPAPAATNQAEVIETMNAGGYTYVLLENGGKQEWYAGPQTQVAVGDIVIVPQNSMAMTNFESKALGRTFEVIYFANAITRVDAGAGGNDAATAMKKAHGTVPTATVDVDVAGIEKAEGGMTVAEVFKAGKGARGQEITLRGKVVKYNAGIMGKNWLHVRDGSGAVGMNDLTITTQDTAKVGDTVLVTGKISADRDFGYGYKYDLLIEDAKVVVE